MRIERERPLLLASASPRRRELLDLARIPFEVVRHTADEAIASGENPHAYVARTARAKLAGATMALDEAARRRGAAVLAADTTVILDGRVLGKPSDDAEARAMLGKLAGVTHEVATAFAIGDAREARLLAEHTVRTSVTFRAIDAAEIASYVATGECRDKAGAYAIQGMAGGFVLRIEGSSTNVIGLPVAELVMELRRLELL